MSASSSFPSGHPRAAIVTRLRQAGCVFAEDEARLLISAARTPADLAAMVDRRAAGQPLEHVLGWAEFCGLRIAVDPGVFVPRRRTEFLVRQAAALARRAAGPPAPRPPGRPHRQPDPARPRPVVVVDLCCGSGAVGAALAAALDRVELHAADIDPAAVRCARRNVAAAGGQVYRGDLYAPLPARLRGRIDILAANVPYVPTGAVGLLPPEARIHEPRVALDGGADGLDVLRRVDRRGATVAGARRSPAGRDERAPGAAGRRGRRPRRTDPAGGPFQRLNTTVVIGTRPYAAGEGARLTGLRRLGEPGVQPVPDLVRGIGAAAPFGTGDHHAGGGDTGQACQSQHFPPAHLLRLDHARREHRSRSGRGPGPHR